MLAPAPAAPRCADGAYNQGVERPTGRELIANLRLRHRQEASPAALLQLVIAILAGALWWFTCIYYLMRAPEAVVRTWHIVVIAVPCAAITLGWHFATTALGARLRTRYSR